MSTIDRNKIGRIMEGVGVQFYVEKSGRAWKEGGRPLDV